MGAAGRDFHNFNVFFRDNPAHEVVAFTAAQIPHISGRTYPPELAGPNYPLGIPILPEEELSDLIGRLEVEQVVFAYSDLSHEEVMHRASLVLAAGADFCLLGPRHTQLKSSRRVVSIGAVRTGAGKSPLTRRVARVLRQLGYRVVPVRHPMPYGDLVQQAVQRFGAYADLERQGCTIEEREEYEPLLEEVGVVYAGVDYQRILRQAEAEADVILWDGGNNDLPFFVSDLHIVVADPHRPGHERTYHPGEANVRMADVLVINKVDTAAPRDVAAVRAGLRSLNPRATLIEAASPIRVEHPEAVRGRCVLVVEDGPTLTHGGMAHGAGWLAAQRHGAVIVDPRSFAVGSIRDTYRDYPTLGPVLPAMGYGRAMIEELEQTINAAEVDLVLVGTPIDLARFLRINKPVQRVCYEVEEIGRPTLDEVLRERLGPARSPVDSAAGGQLR
jgi:predicted GTPase